MNNNKQIVLVGGAHIDIAGKPSHQLRQGEKNYGKVSFSAGGVAYNVAYKLSCLGFKPTLISLVCDDANSQIIKQACSDNGIDLSQSLKIEGKTTPIYLYIADFDGDTHFGISDMQLYNEITPEFLKSKIDYINEFEICFIDGNLSKDALQYLLENIRIPTIIDPVSVDHCKKLKDIIHMASIIKPNEKELAALCGITPDSKEALDKAKDYFIGKGVQKVFFSLGEDGLYYADQNTQGHIKKKLDNIVDANGAGDSMVAGLIYAFLQGENTHNMARYGVASSHIALQGENSNIENLIKKTEEIK